MLKELHDPILENKTKDLVTFDIYSIVLIVGTNV
jgi:hypothetical protein